MGDLQRQSPAQKRRAGGSPSSYGYGISGRSGGVSPIGTEDAMATGLAGAAQSGSPRAPMAMDAIKTFVNQSALGTTHGEAHPRFSLPAGDPAFFPTARPEPTYLGKAGARYGLQVSVPIPVMPEAGATQANGRVIRGRGTGGSFWGAQV